ncbi:MAG TPA: DnaA regulatory inactivator Hda [Noviherbaspirillum sp.]|nr:DnaA regulatory inactivator Hda [Noviherbaspirillum sp.]
MRQLPLDLGAAPPQTLANFAVGQNAELLQLLHACEARAQAMPLERFIYLWGESGAGKTHLLHALAGADDARYFHGDVPATALEYEPGVALYLLDDCHRLSPDAQIAAFALFNQVRDNGGLMVTAGDLPPASLTLREDLRTRLGWGLIYQVHSLTDEDKVEALQQIAQARGLNVSAGVLPYLITHFRRDMGSLAAMLDALDRYSLETRRPVTLPLLRDLLQQEAQAQE